MTEMSWHAEPELLRRYADGALPSAPAASVEAHLLVCVACRVAMPAPRMLDAGLVWREVIDRVDRGERGLIERALTRVGLAPHLVRLLLATPALRRSWLLAVAVALGFAVAAAHGGGGQPWLFLLLAPLLPVAGVATAYGPGVDPLYELAVAAPLCGFRLLLLRAVAVLVASGGLAGLAVPLLPGARWVAVAWLLPALTLTLASLALAVVVPAAVAGAVVGGAWLAFVTSTALGTGDRLAAFHGWGQLGLAIAALLLAPVVAAAATRIRKGDLA